MKESILLLKYKFVIGLQFWNLHFVYQMPKIYKISYAADSRISFLLSSD